MEALAYLNGKMVPLSQARISVLDYGFRFGYGVFGGMRAYKGKVFRLDTKLNRIKESAEKLGIATDVDTYKAAIMDTIRANNLQEARVILSVSSGEGSASPDPQSCTAPTVVVTATEYTPIPAEMYEKGYRALVASVRRNSQSPASGMKTLNYLESIMARQEARTAGFDEAVQLNEKGKVAEASTGNLFLVKDNILKTPGVDSGIIPGIVREVLLELAPQLNIEAIETDIELDELFSADEAFLTNVLMEVMPLVAVNDRPIGSGKPGDITKQLMTAYRNLALKETA